MKVIFATKCWEKDWQKMLAGGFERKIEACNYSFEATILIENNGVPQDVTVGVKANRIYDVDHWLSYLKSDFKLSDINVYASGELLAVFAADNFDDYVNYPEYLCYVQGDCITQGDWIEKGIKILETEPDVSVVSPASEVNTWHNKDGYDHYMSDQAWLVRIAEFNNPSVYQYSLHMPHDPDYPDYGGNSFEHMVGCYLKATSKKRKIIEEAWCAHPAY